ncbi:MAG TPA: PfkB family carbohydrate kinase [Kofleriaceae bacterium]|nr:PfkB family carbohydrate kinase [Kofleriaceae bacterium]
MGSEPEARAPAEPVALALGRVGVELTCRVPRIAPEAPVEMDEISIQVGGGAAIAAATAAALGCKARLACKLADEFLGQHVRSALTGAGIETRAVMAPGRQLSPLAITTLGERGRRAHYFTGGDVDPLTGDEIEPDELLAGVGAVLVDGTCPSAQVALAEAARARGVPVVLDGDHIREGIGTLVGLSDVLICSERLASELAPRDDLEASLAEIQRLGPGAIIITLGDAGAVGLHGDELVREQAFPVDVIDSSGAGAVFHGAFTAALLGQLPFQACMVFASAAAALACRKLGSFGGIPARDEVVALVKSRTGAAGRS